jgi:NSS family neurotransmitter:Na+ symporter
MALVVFIIGVPSMLGFGAVDALTNLAFYEGTMKSAMDMVQDIFYVVGLPLGGFLMSVFIATRWKTHNMSEEISHGHPSYRGSILEKFFNIMIKYICPFVLGTMFILTMLQKFFGVGLI